MNNKIPAKKRASFFRDILLYLRSEKKYWLLPLVVVLILFSALIIISESLPIISPFIYTLF